MAFVVAVPPPGFKARTVPSLISRNVVAFAPDRLFLRENCRSLANVAHLVVVSGATRTVVDTSALPPDPPRPKTRPASKGPSSEATIATSLMLPVVRFC